MKKLIAILLCVALVVSFAACGNKKEDEEKTKGEMLFDAFVAEAQKTTDLSDIANALANADVCGYDAMTMEVSEGFLNGFDSEISGFTKGYVISPMIGAIPFICYVFESDDPDALLKTLEDHKDLRWNICTEAAESYGNVKDNLVFFTMIPGDEE